MDTIIIGAGIAGLTAANYLARAGKKVRILERSKDTGGRARTEQDRGYFYNLGAHALYRGGAAQAVLRELGIAYSGHLAGGPGAFAIAGKKLHTLPSGPLSLLTTGLLGLGGKLELARILGGIGKASEKIDPALSVAEWTATIATDPMARSLIAMLARIATYGADPASMSAKVMTKQLALALANGVDYLDGGWGALVESMRASAIAAGAVIETSAPVAKVDGNHVTLDDGRRLSARTVILTVAPKEAAALLGGAAGELLNVFAAKAVPALAACLDVGLSRLPRAKASAAFGADEPTYVSVHSNTAKLAPAGGALIHALKYLDPRATHDPVAVERELEETIELLQPGWRSAIVKKRFLPHMTVMNALIPPSVAGAPHRPGVRFPGAPANVLLAGDWIGSDYLLADASFASAKEAAQAAIAQLGQLGEARAA